MVLEEPTDPRQSLIEGFADAVRDLREEDLAGLSPHVTYELGRDAVSHALAHFIWARSVGDTLSTTEVCRLLGVTRQAVAKRVRSGSLLGLPGRYSTLFPTWQFDLSSGSIRPEVRLVISTFRDCDDDIDPFVIAAWATTAQEEDLGGFTPSEWLVNGKDRDALLETASRAAARLAQ